MNKKFDLFEYNNMLGEEIQMSYNGPIDAQVIKLVEVYTNRLLNEYPKASTKLFKIFIELAQNISFYSIKRVTNSKGKPNTGVGTIIIGEQNGCYVFVAGNYINNSDVNDLTVKCEKINSLNKTDLRKYKREQRRLPSLNNKGGGNIGLIQAAILSGNPIDMKITEVDDKSSFLSITITIEIDK